MGLGAPELLIILVVVLLLFGSTRLPKLARSLGQASKEFKDGVSEGSRGDDTTATPKSEAPKTEA
jgi:sec-independent protein translocase protein TatA